MWVQYEWGFMVLDEVHSQFLLLIFHQLPSTAQSSDASDNLRLDNITILSSGRHCHHRQPPSSFLFT